MKLSSIQINKLHRIQLEIAIEVKRICEAHEIKYSLVAGTLLGAVRHNGFIPWDDDLDIGMLRDDYFLQTWYSDPNFALPIVKIRKNGTIFRELNSKKTNIHSGVFIDIFPFDNVPNSYLSKLKQNYTTYIFKRLLLIKCNYEVWKKSEITKKVVYKIARGIMKYVTRDRLIKMCEHYMLMYNNYDSDEVVAFGGSYGYWKETIEKSWLELLTDIYFEGVGFKCPQNYLGYLYKFYGDFKTLPPENERCNKHEISELCIGED